MFRKIVINFSSLAFVRILVMLTPFVYLPLLIRVLGVELYGSMVLYQSIAFLASAFIDFGFDLSATKRLSKIRFKLEKKNLVYSSVIFIKLAIFLSVSLFVIVLSFLIDRDNILIIFIFIISTIESVFFSKWYFQGIEKMYLIPIITLTSRIFLISFIFLFVKSESDLIYYPLAILGSSLISSFSSMYYVRFVDGVKISFQKQIILKLYFFDSLPLFFSRVFTLVSSKLSVFFINYFFGREYVAYYDVAEKIISILLIPLQMINQVLFPIVSRNKSVTFVLKTMAVIFPLFSSAAFILNVNSVYIFEIIDVEDYEKIGTILSILIFIIPIQSLNYFLGNTILVVHGLTKEFTYSVVCSFIFLFVCLAAIFTFDIHNIESVAIAQVGAFGVMLVFRFYFARKLIKSSSREF